MDAGAPDTAGPEDDALAVAPRRGRAAAAAEVLARSGEPGGLLRDAWYFAMPSATLAHGAMRPATIAGEPLLFCRAADGVTFALRDICPHRAIPLRHGSFDGNEVECCYHGWRFDRTGACTAVPSLVEGQHLNLARINCGRYPVHEAQGCVWVFVGADDDGVPLPRLPDVANGRARLVLTSDFPCNVDHAVVGLMDPAHGPFVHKSWWWRPGGTAHAKAKRFGPVEQGFAMLRHRPSSNSLAYRLLGGVPETEIAFRLPGIRTEHVVAGRHEVLSLTCVTPVDAQRTVVYQILWWTPLLLTLLKPVIAGFARAFVNQDRRVVVLQQEGLAHDPPLMLVNDADTQARWYYRLKRDWACARAEGRPFVNPVPETVLRWTS